MITPNVARDYKWRLELTPDLYDPGGPGFAIDASVTKTVTYGQAFDDVGTTEHGFKSRIVQRYETTGGTAEWEFTFSSPWGDLTVGPTTALRSLIKCEIQIDNLLLTAECGGAWAISYDELRVYLQDAESGSLVLKATYYDTDGDGPLSNSGTGFDKRLNVSAFSADTTWPVLAEDESMPDFDCVDTGGDPGLEPSEADSYHYWTQAGGAGGWKWSEVGAADWQVDDVYAQQFTPPDPAVEAGCSTCDCEYALVQATVDATEKSWLIEFGSRKDTQYTVTDLGLRQRLCTPLSGYSSWQEYELEHDRYMWENAINAVTTSAGLPESTKTAAARCYCQTPPAFNIDTETSDDAYAKSEVSADVWRRRQVICCGYVRVPCVLPPGTPNPDFGYPASQCEGQDPYDCGYEAYCSLVWPSLVGPDCDEGQKNPWNYHLRQNHYHRAITDQGDVWHRQVNWGYPASGFDVSAQVTTSGADSHPRMAVDPLTQRMYETFVRDATSTTTLYVSTSDDEGSSWTTPVATISDAKYGTVNSSLDGTLVIAGFKYVSGTSGPGHILTAVKKLGETAFPTATAVTDGSATLTFSDDTFHISQAFDGPQTWVLTARPSGSNDVREYRSFDDCATFEIV